MVKNLYDYMQYPNKEFRDKIREQYSFINLEFNINYSQLDEYHIFIGYEERSLVNIRIEAQNITNQIVKSLMDIFQFYFYFEKIDDNEAYKILANIQAETLSYSLVSLKDKLYYLLQTVTCYEGKTGKIIFDKINKHFGEYQKNDNDFNLVNKTLNNFFEKVLKDEKGKVKISSIRNSATHAISILYPKGFYVNKDSNVVEFVGFCDEKIELNKFCEMLTEYLKEIQKVLTVIEEYINKKLKHLNNK